MRKYIDAFTVKRYTGIFIIVAVVAVFSLITKVTIAYLGTNDSAKNTVNVGYGDVSIDESFEEPSELSMENDITKQVKIQNRSTVPAFVRVYAEFADSSLADKAKVTYGEKTYTWDDFKTKLDYSNPSEDVVASKWRYVPADATNGLGGYFYYTEALAAPTYVENGENPTYAETGNLFDSVIIDYNKYVKNEDNEDVPADSNIDRIQPLEMIIYSELVQTVDTGKTRVITTLVDDDGNNVTGEGIENPVKSSVYGYDYAKDNNWKDAWRRFLKLDSNREQKEKQTIPDPEEPEPEPDPEP